MNVKLVGINTNGKYTGSTTIKDWDENGNVNPNHKYAMQPIIVKYSNSSGVSDYVDGLVPDIILEEDVANLLPFGDPNETLLKAVLDDMKGLTVIGGLKSAQLGFQKVADSQDFKPFGTEMYVNPLRKTR
jgi:C-terminal processing protease CtpA/Prc